MNKELNLDFSGGPKSWFDLWHTHLDWDGIGNRNWETRKIFLEEILETFDQLKSNLMSYPNDFQLWIMIDEKDSGQDGIYIHTENPNADNFPLKLAADNTNGIKDRDLRQFLDSLDLEKVRVRTSEGDVYYLFEKGSGISLV